MAPESATPTPGSDQVVRPSPGPSTARAFLLGLWVGLVPSACLLLGRTLIGRHAYLPFEGDRLVEVLVPGIEYALADAKRPLDGDERRLEGLELAGSSWFVTRTAQATLRELAGAHGGIARVEPQSLMVSPVMTRGSAPRSREFRLTCLLVAVDGRSTEVEVQFEWKNLPLHSSIDLVAVHPSLDLVRWR